MKANDDIADLQTAIIYERGSAKQYNKTWGIDLSLWWGVISGCVTHLFNQSFHKRHLFISYFSGADIINIEGCNFFDSNGNPNPLTQTINEFGAFLMKYNQSDIIGILDTPVALLTSIDSGYITPPYWLYKLSKQTKLKTQTYLLHSFLVVSFLFCFCVLFYHIFLRNCAKI